MRTPFVPTVLAAALLLTTTPAAAEYRGGGKLLLTDGVTSIDGAGGGGLATWATIAGRATKDGIGGTVHSTLVAAPDYQLRSYGVAVGLYDRVELSYAHQDFDTGKTGAKLGLGRGFTFHQDIYGAKLRLFGNLVYDQATWLPQVSIGVQHKAAAQGAVIDAIGGRSDSGTDFYAAATKLVLDRGVLLNATMRLTKANQDGLLGFGGDRHGRYGAQFEGSAGVMLTPNLVVGGEYRTKPDNLGFAREDDWYDLFVAVAVGRAITVTAAYADLGSIATFDRQRSLFLSLRGRF